MEINSFTNKVLDLLKNQDYGVLSKQLNYDQLIRNYAHGPNEAVYIVDCQTAEMEFLTDNISRLFDINHKVENSLVALYENIKTPDYQNVLDFGNKAMRSVLSERDRMLSLGEKLTCVYRTPTNRTIMKNTYVLAKDSIGQIRYTLGQLVDVTDLVAFKGFRYQVYGPNATQILASIGDLQEYGSILSKREIEVLIFCSQGLLSKQIATEMFISKGTVDKHRKNIIEKLEVANSLAAYKKAIDMGIISGL